MQDSAGEAADVRGAGQEEVVERRGHLAHPREHQRPLPVVDRIQHQISEPHQQKVGCCLTIQSGIEMKLQIHAVTDKI